MNTNVLERHFAKIGARAKIAADANRFGGAVRLDIGRDDAGEFFDIRVGRTRDLDVVDTQPKLRHLLLMSREHAGKAKFLCGHDERHWFVAAVPEQAAAASVRAAFDALKPTAVHSLENQLRVKPSKRHRRRNAAFHRQGEWFFVPVQRRGLINERLVLRNEPIARAGGKPHLCEELVRQGGELVYVSPPFPNGLTERQYQKRISSNPKLRNLQWVAQLRNPSVFVRGKIRHPDHKTILLDGWHQVLMNTEHQAIAMRHVAFID